MAAGPPGYNLFLFQMNKIATILLFLYYVRCSLIEVLMAQNKYEEENVPRVRLSNPLSFREGVQDFSVCFRYFIKQMLACSYILTNSFQFLIDLTLYLSKKNILIIYNNFYFGFNFFLPLFWMFREIIIYGQIIHPQLAAEDKMFLMNTDYNEEDHVSTYLLWTLDGSRVQLNQRFFAEEIVKQGSSSFMNQVGLN